MELKFILEPLLFSAQKPMTAKELRDILATAATAEEAHESAKPFKKTKEDDVTAALEELAREHETAARSFRLVCVAGAWQFVTQPEFAPWLKALVGVKNRPSRLSQAALETLSIIAYRQPVTRADIEAVRGVAVDGVMQSLLERGLVRIAGRADVPGRPLLYETTQLFMEHFGLRSLDELPNVDELRRVRLPSSTLPTTGELFPPAALVSDDEETSEPEPASELPPAEEPALTEADAESVPSESSPTDHAADPNP